MVVDFYEIAYELMQMILWVMIGAGVMLFTGMICFLVLVSKATNGLNESPNLKKSDRYNF